MKQWTLAVGLVVLILGAIAATIGVARAGAMTTHHGVAARAGASTAGCQHLMSDPAAMKVMHTLCAVHHKDMQVWRAQYGADPTSPEARRALRGLWREHNGEMRTAFSEAGVKPPAGVCLRQMMSAAPDMMGGATGAGMMDAVNAGAQHEQHHGATGGATGMMGTGTGMMGGSY